MYCNFSKTIKRGTLCLCLLQMKLDDVQKTEIILSLSIKRKKVNIQSVRFLSTKFNASERRIKSVLKWI